MSNTGDARLAVISLETFALLLLGVLDIGVLRRLLPLPLWITLANLFWPVVLGSLLVDCSPLSALWRERVKTVAAVGAIIVFAYAGTISMIALRHTVAPHHYVHDNAVLIEEGIKQLLSGRNYYAVDYRGTALEAWQGGKFYDANANTWFDNPALDHYITLPFYTLASAPVYWVSTRVIGWYDQRFVDLLVYAIVGAVAWRLPSRRWRVLALLLIALNPLQLEALLVGTSDTFVLAFLLLAVWLITRQRPLAAAVAMAFSAASKQTSWLAIPLLVVYACGSLRETGLAWRPALGRLVRQWWPLPAVFAAFVLPFLWWDAGAFIDDVYRYPAGLLPTSFPIIGEGLSVLLQLLGLPPSPRAYFPYGYLQLLIGGPVFFLLMFWLLRRPSLSRALGSAGVFSLTYLWLSRFFNGNYLTMPIALLTLATILSQENSEFHTQLATINSKHQIPNKPQ